MTDGVPPCTSDGITTAEYAVGTAAGAGLAGPALQAAHRRVRRQAAARALRPRPRAAGDRMTRRRTGARRQARRGDRGAGHGAAAAGGRHHRAGLAAGGGVAQVRTVDAARETARAVARGDADGRPPSPGAAGRRRRGAASRSSPRRARSWSPRRSRSPGPGGLFGWLPGVRVPGRSRRRHGGPAMSRAAARRGHAAGRQRSWAGCSSSVAAGLAWSSRWSRSPACPGGRRPRGARGRAGAGRAARTAVPRAPDRDRQRRHSDRVRAARVVDVRVEVLVRGPQLAGPARRLHGRARAGPG